MHKILQRVTKRMPSKSNGLQHTSLESMESTGPNFSSLSSSSDRDFLFFACLHSRQLILLVNAVSSGPRYVILIAIAMTWNKTTAAKPMKLFTMVLRIFGHQTGGFHVAVVWARLGNNEYFSNFNEGNVYQSCCESAFPKAAWR